MFDNTIKAFAELSEAAEFERRVRKKAYKSGGNATAFLTNMRSFLTAALRACHDPSTVELHPYVHTNVTKVAYVADGEVHFNLYYPYYERGAAKVRRIESASMHRNADGGHVQMFWQRTDNVPNAERAVTWRIGESDGYTTQWGVFRYIPSAEDLPTILVTLDQEMENCTDAEYYKTLKHMMQFCNNHRRGRDENLRPDGAADAAADWL